jgi:hypothetical protein
MNSFNNILDMFPEREMKDNLNDIIVVIDELSHKTPVVGFHHSFYVPGWIGFFQLMFVESKMNKFASQSFCRNMNYFEFGDWLINKSKEIADLQKRTATEDQQITESQNDAIIRVFKVLAALWMNYLPEISTYHSIKYTENTLISPAGMVYKGLEENLKGLGYEQSDDSGKGSKSSVKDDAKGCLYSIVGYILNILLLAAIFGLLGAIFG